MKRWGQLLAGDTTVGSSENATFMGSNVNLKATNIGQLSWNFGAFPVALAAPVVHYGHCILWDDEEY